MDVVRLSVEREEAVVLLRKASEALRARYGGRVVAVGLFGSVARGEAGERSDVDVLVIVRDWPRGLERRRQLYRILHSYLGGDVTLIDVDYEVAIELAEGRRPLYSTMLNILYDCVVVYDPEGVLARLREAALRIVEEYGLIRVKHGRAYYWARKDGRPLVQVEEDV
ncbi:MAG: hypothetical protein DRJ57_05835 [Thermoprotei archaeon]|nr:MAG: hypothetical protein DRJ57_05835 [Thermoprotei archaeon]